MTGETPKDPDDRRSEINRVTERIIACIYRVSNTLGSGFLEKVYENALAIELRQNGLKTEQQHPIRVFYNSEPVGDFAADLLVEDCVIVELNLEGRWLTCESLTSKSGTDEPGEFGEIAKLITGNGVNNSPVDLPVVVHGDIAKAHGLLQLLGQILGYGPAHGQDIEGLPHRIRWRHLHAGDEVRANVHAQLHSPGKIDGDDILKIRVSTQCVRIGRTFVRDALKTATQGFEFLLDHFPIHACLLSTRILLR